MKKDPAASPDRKLRIAVLARGLSVQVGGARRFVEEMARQLPVVDREGVYGIFHNAAEQIGSFGDAEEIYHPGRSTWCWENIWFPSAVRKWRADIVLCPKNLVPFGLPRGCTVVSCLLDMAYYPRQGHYLAEYKWYDVAYIRCFLPRSIRRADTLVCISDYTARDVIDLFNVPEERIQTVLLGVNPPPPEALSEAHLQKVRATYGLDQPYIFYAGSLSPRKNMARVVRAFKQIEDRIPHQLVVTAGKSWKDEAVFEAVRSCGLDARFVKLGTVPERDLPALYHLADLFIFPSLYEGFGLPVLEAMACGCPVLTSTTTSLPEAAGEAAALVDPEDETAIADAILSLLQDPERREELRVKGVERAEEMRWNRTARSLASVLHAAHSAAKKG